MNLPGLPPSIDSIESGVVLQWRGGRALRLIACTPDILRVSLSPDGSFATGGLERYGFIRTDWPEIGYEISIGDVAATLRTDAMMARARLNDGALSVRAGGRPLLREYGSAWSGPDGFGARFNLRPDERFIGLGDQTRDRLEHRGHRGRMWIRDVLSYTPVPFFMSSRGFGVFVNSTWRHVFDMGATSDKWFGFAGEQGHLDYFIINGPSYAEILDRYTDITGKPYIPPAWSFGLWFICHTEANARDMMDDCLRFRDRDIPCDVIGLEPGWMEHNYDFTLDKRWHPERFSIPSYCPNGPHNFLNAAVRMGYKPMLWLCCDYDLSLEEEALVGAEPRPAPSTLSEKIVAAFEQDEHLSAERRMDTQTRPGEPWFSHLKQFIDQGVELFKQDGANQVLDHPDRRWGNGMDDEEMHNLYPLLYSRQMHQGFRQHTGRRATCFTPSGYAGLQRWTGTWAGDTGGGPKPLVSMLNLSLSGHSLMTCDMEVTSKEGIHFGFLQPWAQLNSWNYWRQPWYQGSELESTFSFYDHLRYCLLPYLYTMAHVAHRTGMPILRAMPLMYPDDPASYEALNQYMLGESLLISAFDQRVHLPAGDWFDLWTGASYTGPVDLQYEPPDGRGGGLFMKAGSALPFTADFAAASGSGGHIGTATRHGGWSSIGWLVAPGGDCEGLLVEDDGMTYAYEDGCVCDTKVAWLQRECLGRLVIHPCDATAHRPPDGRGYCVRVIAGSEPAEVLLDGEALPRDAECGNAWAFGTGLPAPHDVLSVAHLAITLPDVGAGGCEITIVPER